MLLHQRLGGFFIKVHYSWTRIIMYTDFVATLPCPDLIVFAFRSARGTYKAVLPVPELSFVGFDDSNLPH